MSTEVETESIPKVKIKKTKVAKAVEATPPPKAKPKKAAKAVEPEPKAKGEQKWLPPLLKTLATAPAGMTRKQLCEALGVNDFSGALVKNPMLIRQEKQEGSRGFVYQLTAEGKKAARKA